MNVLELELAGGGVLEYRDTGSGSVVVLLHGLMMDASLWDEVVADLGADHRCVAPTLPLGAHRRAMPRDADLSLPAIARMAGELLERLDLRGVTLVGNDTGGALAQLLMRDADARIARVVPASCDAFENFPPGLTGRTLFLLGRLPPWLFGAFMQQMRLRAVRRLPLAFGRLTRRGDAACARWIRPLLASREVRRDTVRMLRAAAAASAGNESGSRNKTGLLVEAARHLSGFDRPVLVVWARGDRVMPPQHGRRLARLVPDGRLVEVDDSSTLIPLDQPGRLAAAVRAFVAQGAQVR